nr:immunoglobulin light chain junction region [Macaca mulatta]
CAVWDNSLSTLF